MWCHNIFQGTYPAYGFINEWATIVGPGYRAVVLILPGQLEPIKGIIISYALVLSYTDNFGRKIVEVIPDLQLLVWLQNNIATRIIYKGVKRGAPGIVNDHGLVLGQVPYARDPVAPIGKIEIIGGNTRRLSLQISNVPIGIIGHRYIKRPCILGRCIIGICHAVLVVIRVYITGLVQSGCAPCES
jgi:hypothetical protein